MNTNKRTPSSLQYVSPRLQYSLEETDGKALQIIVHPATSIAIDKKSFCWGSTDLEFQPRSSSVQDFFGSPASSVADIVNPTNSPVICCLSKVRGDRVCELKLGDADKVAEKGLFVTRDCLLCCSEEVKLVHNKTWMLTSSANTWMGQQTYPMIDCHFIEGVKGMVFLQSEGAVVRKDLATAEKILVDSAMLLAHSQSCSIAVSDVRADFYCVTGPGLVLMSAHTTTSRFIKTNAALMQQAGGGGGVGSLLLRLLAFTLLSVLFTVAADLAMRALTDGEVAAAIRELIDELQRE